MTAPATDAASLGEGRRDSRAFTELLRLEQISETTYVSIKTFADPYPMFGGQLAAQALVAAGHTISGERAPHSIHGYFLRPGDAALPVEFEVVVERDGRRFSSRRIIARQNGKVIFTADSSFDDGLETPDGQVVEAPDVEAPMSGDPWEIPRVFSFEGRAAEQAFPHQEMRTRYWARCTASLGDAPLQQACAVAYVADITNGVAHFDSDSHSASSSLDYSVWFHRPARADQWMLVDLVPRVVAGGRGFYGGSVFDQSGSMIASLAQETLYRRGPTPTYWPFGER